jgi:hypothetical protein
MSDDTVFDAREAFADEERGGDLLWSDTPAQTIPFRRRKPVETPSGRAQGEAEPQETDHVFDPHGDPLHGKAARKARVAARNVAPLGRPGAGAPGVAGATSTRNGPGAPGGAAAPSARPGAGAPGGPAAPGAARSGPTGVAPVAPPRPAAPAKPHVAPAVAPPRRGGPRRLGEPRAVRVEADRRGRPLAVDGRPVDGVRESWLVEDRWWTDRPLRRRYWEVVTDDGRNLVVFRELGNGGWYCQRG